MRKEYPKKIYVQRGYYDGLSAYEELEHRRLEDGEVAVYVLDTIAKRKTDIRLV